MDGSTVDVRPVFGVDRSLYSGLGGNITSEEISIVDITLMSLEFEEFLVEPSFRSSSSAPSSHESSRLKRESGLLLFRDDRCSGHRSLAASNEPHPTV